MPSGTRRRVHNGKHYFYLSRQDKDPGPDLAYIFKINAILHSVHFKYFAHLNSHTYPATLLTEAYYLGEQNAQHLIN